MDILATFSQQVAKRHEYGRAWKAHGGRVAGYLCTYMPEEILHAAGMLPVRLFGSGEPSTLVERHIDTRWCPFCRSCMGEALEGHYDYVSGLVYTHCCWQMLQVIDSWRRHLPVEFAYYLYIPALDRDSSRDYLTKEFAHFQEALGDWAGKKVTEEAIRNSIQVYNKNRALLRQVYEMRRPNPPLFSGAEATAIVLAGLTMDKEEHSHLLTQAVAEAKKRKGVKPGVRLMFVGSENTSIELIDFVEGLGANVVADDNCMGSRYFWSDVVLDSQDPLTAMSTQRLSRPQCPQKDTYIPRLRPIQIAEQAKEFNVQGIIFHLVKFCDPHEWDFPIIRNTLQEQGIPTITLETDMTIPVGQFRTRVEAFLEMVEADV